MSTFLLNYLTFVIFNYVFFIFIQLDMSDKKSILGMFCREESPRLCDHALLSNATRATRPCAPSESYITTGPALTILQVMPFSIEKK